jgi:hypothetical protein
VQQTAPAAGVELNATDSIGTERLVARGTDARQITDAVHSDAIGRGERAGCDPRLDGREVHALSVGTMVPDAYWTKVQRCLMSYVVRVGGGLVRRARASGERHHAVKI